MNKRKNNRKRGRHIFITVLISALSLALNGCSLAIEDAGTASKDTLIGVFITTDYLDLYDMDIQIEDNTFSLLGTSDIVIENSDKYTEILYADIDRNDSDNISDWDISFKGIKGMKFLAPIWKDRNGTIGYSSQVDDGICEPVINLNTAVGTDAIEMSATIYNLSKPGENDPTFHLNPVYQTVDGKIYTTPGSGISTGFYPGEQAVISTTVSNETTSVANNKTATEKTDITIHLSIMYEPVKITLFQMDDDNKIIKQDEYTPGELPEQLTIKKDASYVIAETEKKAPDGALHTDRILYDRNQADNEEFLKTFYIMEDNILAEQYTAIKWEE